ncbi:hypothetical protein AcW1_009779 [Taiwanofungus camphoratus]|nr:hypothetical protein AcW1_009779 [Antrodia cinnamomea]
MSPSRAGGLFSTPGMSALVLSLLAVPVCSAPTARTVVCRQNAEIVWNMLVFFATNYLAHAATVPTTPRVDEHIRVDRPKFVPAWAVLGRWPKFIPMTPILALFLPYVGLFRSLYLAWVHVVSDYDQVHAAAAQHAILVVARTRDWKPPIGREELVYVKLPKNYEEISASDSVKMFASFELLDEEHFAYKYDAGPRDAFNHEVKPDEWDVYGEIKVPEGYMMICPAPQILYSIMHASLEDTSGINLCRPQTVLKMLLSAAQLISAILTLYYTRGDQIDRFGYAAYGLSVVPYAIMTMVNLICTAIIGEVPCCYVLRTPILQKAEQCPGAIFNGAIGHLKDARFEAVTTVVTAEETQETEVERDSHEMSLLVGDSEQFQDIEYAATWLSLEDSSTPGTARLLLSELEKASRNSVFCVVRSLILTLPVYLAFPHSPTMGVNHHIKTMSHRNRKSHQKV